MRKIREVLRLKYEAGLSDRKIAASIGSARSTVQECLRRAQQAGVTWPLPPELDEIELQRRLYQRQVPLSRTPQPDFAQLHAELKRSGVTRMLLWSEYKSAHPDGWQYSVFCDQYRSWLATQDLVLRQHHTSGEKLFVASLRTGQVDLIRLTITVCGKGGHERTIPLNPQLVEVLQIYVQARGPALPAAPFFRSRFGRPLCRGAVYERVRIWGQRSRVGVPLSPHRMRHTFATHLVRAGVGLVTIRDLLGHRQITSTQIYLHVTAEDLRAAAARHPIGALLATVEHLLPAGQLPFQRARSLCGSA